MGSIRYADYCSPGKRPDCAQRPVPHSAFAVKLRPPSPADASRIHAARGPWSPKDASRAKWCFDTRASQRNTPTTKEDVGCLQTRHHVAVDERHVAQLEPLEGDSPTDHLAGRNVWIAMPSRRQRPAVVGASSTQSRRQQTVRRLNWRAQEVNCTGRVMSPAATAALRVDAIGIDTIWS